MNNSSFFLLSGNYFPICFSPLPAWYLAANVNDPFKRRKAPSRNDLPQAVGCSEVNPIIYTLFGQRRTFPGPKKSTGRERDGKGEELVMFSLAHFAMFVILVL